METKKRMIAIAIAVLAVICGVVIYNVVKSDPPQEEPAPPIPVAVEEPEVDPVQYNNERFGECIDDIVMSIVYSSGFNQTTHPTGERFAYGFNNTVVGKRLVKEGESITPRQAYDVTVRHLKEHVQPFLRYISVQLSDGQIIAVAHFIYNVGGEAFTGYSEDGKLLKKPSRLLTAINDGEQPEICARCFTGFRNFGGIRSDGLLKLRWLQAALYAEAVSVEDLKSAYAAGIFDLHPSVLYEHNRPEKDGYYTPKLDIEIVQKVLKQKGIGTSTNELMKF